MVLHGLGAALEAGVTSQELTTEHAQFVGGREVTFKVPMILNWRKNLLFLPG